MKRYVVWDRLAPGWIAAEGRTSTLRQEAREFAVIPSLVRMAAESDCVDLYPVRESEPPWRVL